MKQITTLINKLLDNRFTIDEVIELVSPVEIYVKCSNYLQYIDKDGNFKEAQLDYKQLRWYEFKTTGRSDSPIETFVKWID